MCQPGWKTTDMGKWYRDIYQLDVEARIATNNFTTPFFDKCSYGCAYIRMCVPDPCDWLKPEWVASSSADAAMSNYMLDIESRRQ